MSDDDDDDDDDATARPSSRGHATVCYTAPLL
jgi:hypothetical protein